MKLTFKKPFILALISAGIIVLSGTALAQNTSSNIDIVRIGSNVIIAEKQVVNDAIAIGSSVTVLNAGRVTGDAVAIGGDITLKSNARVDGDVTAVGGKIIQQQGATIGGDTVLISDRGLFNTFRRWGVGGLLARIYLFSAALHIIAVFAIAAIGSLLLMLQPNFLQAIAATIEQFPLKSGLWGLASAFALILLSILLTGSILGTVLLPVVNLAAIAIGLLGTIAIGLVVGEKVIRASRSLMQRFLIGMLIIGLIGLIPIGGGVFFLAVNISGIGGVLLWKFGKVKPKFIEQKQAQDKKIS